MGNDNKTLTSNQNRGLSQSRRVANAKIGAREIPDVSADDIGPPVDVKILTVPDNNVPIVLEFDHVITREQVINFITKYNRLPSGIQLTQKNSNPKQWTMILQPGNRKHLDPTFNNKVTITAIQKSATRLWEPGTITKIPYLTQETSNRIFSGEIEYGTYEVDNAFVTIRANERRPGATSYEVAPIKSEDIDYYKAHPKKKIPASTRLEAAKMWNRDMRWFLERGATVKEAADALNEHYNQISNQVIAAAAFFYADIGGIIGSGFRKKGVNLGSRGTQSAASKISQLDKVLPRKLRRMPSHAPKSSASVLPDILSTGTNAIATITELIDRSDDEEEAREKELVADGNALHAGFGAVLLLHKVQGSNQPQQHITGAGGEKIARRVLSSRGYTNIIALQNTSGHGIDLVAISKSGYITFIEVKTSFGGRPGKLSYAQRDITKFIRSRLQRIANRQGAYKNVTRATLRRAKELLAMVDANHKQGKPIGGFIIDILNTGNISKLIVSVRRWSRKTPARGSRKPVRKRVKGLRAR